MQVETRPPDASAEATSARPVRFPSGIPAFETHDRFALMEDPQYAPLGWLQSLVDPAIGFLLAPAAEVNPTYRPAINESDLADVGWVPGEARPTVYCILVLHPTDESLTANLKAPIVINWKYALGRQVILSDEHHPLRFPVVLSSPSGRAPGGEPCSS